MATRRIVAISLLLAWFALVGPGSTACASQPSTPGYPTKAIELIVPWGAGGGADITARLTASYLSKKWGQPINVVNLPGASGVTGIKRMLDSPPDGYTLMMGSHSSSSMHAATMADLPYKWDDQTFIARVTVDPVFYVVKDDAPWRTLKEIMDYAGSKPGTLKWASAGLAGIAGFAGPMLFGAAGVKVADTNQVLLESGAACVTAAAGGHVDMAIQQLSEVTALIEAKKIRALAVVLPERVKQFPNVPTLQEAGYNFEVTGWQGVSGQNKVPTHVVQKWSEGIKEASKDMQFLEDAAKVYKVVAYLAPEEFKKSVQAEYERYLPMAEQLGIRK